MKALNRTGPIFHRWLIRVPRAAYHIDDMMSRNYTDRNPLIYQPAMQLYIDKMLSLSVFSERFYIMLLIELDKLPGINQARYAEMFNYGIRNIGQIMQIDTIANIFATAFETKFNNREVMLKFAKRGFEILRINKQLDTEDQTSKSYHTIRFIIGVQGLVGLAEFPNEYYELIEIKKMKPLFVTFFLELLWKAGLQDKYPITQKIIEVLKYQEKLIPYSDIHHMVYSLKVIRDREYTEIVERLQQSLKQSKAGIIYTEETEKRVSPELTDQIYQDYLNDLRKKYY